MVKYKIDKTNAMRLLDRAHITYEALSYPCVGETVLSGVEVADYLQVLPQIVFKTLVTTGDKTGIIVAVIPSDVELDLKVLAKVSGNKSMEMIPVKTIEAVTGYVRGGCSPIAMKKPYPTFVHEDALTHPHIIISAGRRGAQIKIAPRDLTKVISVVFVALYP